MQNLLILGITGSLGGALIRRYKGEYNISGMSRDEDKQWRLNMQHPECTLYIGDIRDLDRVRKVIAISKPHVIIICSAMKHLDICERAISECLKTNIDGVQNVVNASLESPGNIHSVLLISTDKACSPVNVYGMSKSIGERILVEASSSSSTIKFLCVRYGNVINSRGSLIPKFLDIGNGPQEYFPVTEEGMTRFFLNLESSVRLIDRALVNGLSGDTWIPNVKSCYIIDIARWFSKRFNKPIKITGMRPGEKLHEMLINDVEMHRTQTVNVEGEDYFVVKPCYVNYDFKQDISRPVYSSDQFIDTEVQKLIESCLSTL